MFRPIQPISKQLWTWRWCEIVVISNKRNTPGAWMSVLWLLRVVRYRSLQRADHWSPSECGVSECDL